ncbi:MAG: ATP-binding cassette domain-containing protein [Longimicrobiales bacterium]
MSAIRLEGLRKTYGPVVAVDGLDLEIRGGECFGLLGPNGAGKTTTIEICEGLNKPDAGTVEVLGLRWATDARELRERIGISLQETQLAEKITVGETINLFRSLYRTARPLDEVIDAVQLGEKRNGRVGQLSGGQKQRLALALALVSDPELFFLDEPTTGLDPQSRRQIWELIENFRTRGRTVLVTTHYMEEAERLCDRVAIVDHGKVIALGTPRSLIASLGAQYVIEFAVTSDTTLVQDVFRGLPGVVGVRQDEARWRLQVAELHTAMPALLVALDGRGALTELRTHAPTLEDVFVSLTGRHLRDA